MVSHDQHLTYRYYLNNQVHKFIFLKSDEQAIDEFFIALEQAMNDHVGDQPMLMMVDIRPDGIPPFNYTLFAARRFFAEHADRPEFRAAYVYNRSAFLSIIRRFFSLLRLKSDRRFFEGDEIEAMEWLTTKGDTSLTEQPV